MIEAQFKRAAGIEKRAGDFPRLSIDVEPIVTLMGIDLVCRPLFGILEKKVFDRPAWYQAGLYRQTAIQQAYTNLGAASEAVRTNSRLRLPSLERLGIMAVDKESTDLLPMRIASRFASYTAQTIIAHSEIYNRDVNPDVAVMAVAAVQAVTAWSTQQEFFGGEKEATYGDQLEQGLDLINTALVPAGRRR